MIRCRGRAGVVHRAAEVDRGTRQRHIGADVHGAAVGLRTAARDVRAEIRSPTDAQRGQARGRVPRSLLQPHT